MKASRDLAAQPLTPEKGPLSHLNNGPCLNTPKEGMLTNSLDNPSHCEAGRPPAESFQF